MHVSGKSCCSFSFEQWEENIYYIVLYRRRKIQTFILYRSITLKIKFQLLSISNLGSMLLEIFEYLETWLMLVQVEHVQAYFYKMSSKILCNIPFKKAKPPPIYQNNSWTIKRWSSETIKQSFHCIMLKIVRCLSCLLLKFLKLITKLESWINITKLHCGA